MLRQAQHERKKISNDFNRSTVRPETSKDERRVLQRNQNLKYHPVPPAADCPRRTRDGHGHKRREKSTMKIEIDILEYHGSLWPKSGEPTTYSPSMPLLKR
jgi:hypothetical protein